jgi:hypothetical protein
MIAVGRWGGAVVGSILIATALAPAFASAQTTRALIVSGVSGEPRLAQQFERDVAIMRDALSKRFGASTVVLTESSTPRSDKAGITQALQALASNSKAGDQVLIVLVGHASAQGGDVRFNIPGPDITAAEFASGLDALRDRTVAIVIGTSSSGAFISPLTGGGRTIITATKSGAQNEEVVFAGHFAKALSEDVADIDKDGAVSLSEAFEYTKREVTRFYQQHNRIATEQATMIGGDASGFLLRAARTQSASPVLQKMYADRARIQNDITTLRTRKGSMAASAYDAELERLLVLLAVKDREIRAAEKQD